MLFRILVALYLTTAVVPVARAENNQLTPILQLLLLDDASIPSSVISPSQFEFGSQEIGVKKIDRIVISNPLAHELAVNSIVLSSKLISILADTLPINIKPGNTIEIPISIECLQVGVVDAQISFEFESLSQIVTGPDISISVTCQPQSFANFDEPSTGNLFIVPDNVTQISVIMSGASGGNGANGSSSSGGLGEKGDRLETTLNVLPGERLLIDIGGKGEDGDSPRSPVVQGGGGDGGISGGGRGGDSGLPDPNGAFGFTGGGGGGGGVTQISRNTVVVLSLAGGGGGGGGANRDTGGNGGSGSDSGGGGGGGAFGGNGGDGGGHGVGFGGGGGSTNDGGQGDTEGMRFGGFGDEEAGNGGGRFGFNFGVGGNGTNGGGGGGGAFGESGGLASCRRLIPSGEVYCGGGAGGAGEGENVFQPGSTFRENANDGDGSVRLDWQTN